MSGQIAVVNAGAWGTALAVLLARGGHAVRLWCRRPKLAADVSRRRENVDYLPGVEIPSLVEPTASMAVALDGPRAVVLVPISRAVRETASQVAPFIDPSTPVMHASKGLELG
ncbi:MAG TPA: 2-dehydropantoate 2-reductase N-terminal domain-containing protein, partial [Chloroflexota bacterium]|nr:2-dehydropantoate 2-reductase N-terminal domain-containing protein [Chloroflexota bacterium]